VAEPHSSLGGLRVRAPPAVQHPQERLRRRVMRSTTTAGYTSQPIARARTQPSEATSHAVKTIRLSRLSLTSPSFSQTTLLSVIPVRLHRVVATRDDVGQDADDRERRQRSQPHDQSSNYMATLDRERERE